MVRDSLHGTDTTNLSWSAYYASKIIQIPTKCASAMLPLFEDFAHTVAMIRHSMTIIQSAVQYLNPGHIPVLVCDQPLFAIAKQIQWTWKYNYGENKLVLMFGGLHIEMAAWKAVGTWLEGSGWSDVLSESNIATSGKAESYLQASHLKRTRYAHQVTAASLHILCHQAYEYFLADQGTANYQSFEAWCEERANKFPMFTYWYLVLEQELVFSSRTGI